MTANILFHHIRPGPGQNDLATCLARSQGVGCPNSVAAFDNSFGSLVNIGFWAVLLLLPGLIGVVVGAPLLGREMELGTWRLAWSQTVPRTRWLAVKLAVLCGASAFLCHQIMLADLPSERPPHEQIRMPQFSWNASKVPSLHQQYHPESRLAKISKLLIYIGASCMGFLAIIFTYAAFTNPPRH